MEFMGLPLAEYIPRSHAAQRVRCAADVADDSQDLDGHLREAEASSILAGVIGGLTEKHRELIRLRYEDGMTLAQIGERFGVTEAAVCQMHRTAIARIKCSLSLMGVHHVADLC